MTVPESGECAGLQALNSAPQRSRGFIARGAYGTSLAMGRCMLRSTRSMTRDPVKTRRAAADPRRPGADCKAGPGVFRPVVDTRRCEGKGDCVAVCPYDVFEVGTVAEETFAEMPWLVKLRLWAHGKKTAYTPRSDACRACGLCVVACPEHAIELVEHRE
ncbi:MAG TPA: ferredoxin family protein [Myxococcota bacterium]|jgi:NAD-dependent dihydropyrimidine dehydrogenase PreA subunit|nr:ferredoxin family protein [Myxococcota bacterium]